MRPQRVLLVFSLFIWKSECQHREKRSRTGLPAELQQSYMSAYFNYGANTDETDLTSVIQQPNSNDNTVTQATVSTPAQQHSNDDSDSPGVSTDTPQTSNSGNSQVNHSTPSSQGSSPTQDNSNTAIGSLNLISRNWSDYAPTRPSPDQVDCYVEVRVTERRGGRCTMIGGSHPRPVCQSGPLAGFTNECYHILGRAGRRRGRPIRYRRP